MKKISVIICTYKRPNILNKCLQSLKIQTNKNFEVLVIDNANDKRTKKIVSSYTNVKYIVEKNTGLSFARNTGFKNAKYDWIAYLDDDAIAEKDWIENIIKFIKNHPQSKIFGGPYTRYSDIKIPSWFPPEFGNKDLGDMIKQLNPPGAWLSGGNMIILKNLLEKFNGFNTNHGMSGNKVRYGEEIELQQKITNSNIPIYYSPNIKIKHLLRKEKMSLRWLLKNSFSHGLNAYAIKNQKHTLRSHLGATLKAIQKFLKWTLIPNKQPCKRKLYFALKPIFAEMGAIVSMLRS